MPKYGFLCLDCQKRFRKTLSFAEYGTVEVVCPYCESTQLKRLINRVRVVRTEESQIEALTDPEKFEALEEDPRALGKMMREMGKEFGEDMGPEFDEVLDRLEKGQALDDIEADMPNLGGGDAGGLDSGKLEEF